MSCWQVLGLEPTHDQRAIKKAYRALLKEHGPEDDPEMFMRIREAYDQACDYARDRIAAVELMAGPSPEPTVNNPSDLTEQPLLADAVLPFGDPQAEKAEEPVVAPPEPQVFQGAGEIPESQKDWNAAPLIDRMQALFSTKSWRKEVAAWQQLFGDADSLSLVARIEFRAALNHSYLQALDAIIFGRYPDPDVVRLICNELKLDLEVTSLHDIGMPSRSVLSLTEDLLTSYESDADRRARRWSLAVSAVFRHFFSPLGRTTAGSYFLTLVMVYPGLLYITSLFNGSAWSNGVFWGVVAAVLISFAFLSIKRWRDTGRSPLWLGLAVIPVLTVPILMMLIVLDSSPATPGDNNPHNWPLFRSRYHFSRRMKQTLRKPVEEIVS